MGYGSTPHQVNTGAIPEMLCSASYQRPIPVILWWMHFFGSNDHRTPMALATEVRRLAGSSLSKQCGW
jgi:hypothetical protein